MKNFQKAWKKSNTEIYRSEIWTTIILETLFIFFSYVCIRDKVSGGWIVVLLAIFILVNWFFERVEITERELIVRSNIIQVKRISLSDINFIQYTFGPALGGNGWPIRVLKICDTTDLSKTINIPTRMYSKTTRERILKSIRSKNNQVINEGIPKKKFPRLTSNEYWILLGMLASMILIPVLMGIITNQ